MHRNKRARRIQTNQSRANGRRRFYRDAAWLIPIAIQALALVACDQPVPPVIKDGPAPPAAAALGETDEIAAQEIVELHDFLLVWFRADTDQSEQAFRRFDDALATDFSMVGPDGTSLTREQVIDGVFGDWGRWRDEADPRITIENVEVLERDEDTIRVRYEEHQSTSEAKTVRTSTVLLRAAADAPLGHEWVDLRETWKVPPPEATLPAEAQEP